MFEKRKKVGGGGIYCGINKNQPQHIVVDAQKPQNDANEQSVKNTYKNQQDTHTRLNIASERKRILNKKQCEESSMKIRINNEIKGNTYSKTSANGKAHIKIYSSAKYILLWLFAFVFALVAVCLVSNDKYGLFNPVSAVYTDGTGTENDPYIISTEDDLNTLASNVNKGDSDSSAYFKMANDITVTTTWTPIGKHGQVFSGTFDGDGHRITFDSGSEMSLSVGYAGLFGLASGATIKNVGVNWKYGLSITSNSVDVGGIVGFAYSTTISNCYNTGSVTATCTSVVYAGGISGYNSGSTTISNCYNTGSVSATSTSGSALVGGISGYYGTVTNCFSVVGSSNNAPSAIGTSNYAGGIVGVGGSVKNCYYDYGGGSGTKVLTTAGYTNDLSDFVKNATYFSSDDTTLSGSADVKSWNDLYPWDFKNTWTIESALNNGYPILKNSIASYADYTISDEADLIALSNAKSSTSGASTSNTSHQNFKDAWGTSTSSPYILVTNDITVTASSWTPIGNSSKMFYSTFDGGGHKITFKELITGTAGSYGTHAGLFDYTYTSVIKNLGVNWEGGLKANSRDNYCGGIVSYDSGNTVIENCYTSGTITATGGDSDGMAGGIVEALGSESIIKNCYSSCTINVDSYGLVRVGGIVASAYGSIYNCYNIGSISGKSDDGYADVGGISGSGGTITNCFSVVGRSSYSGGGIVGDGGSTSGCYFDYGTTSGVSTGGTKITGLADLMKVESNFTNGSFKIGTTTYNWNTGADYKWDFENTWEICLGANNNFPILKNSFMSFVDYTINDATDLIALSNAKSSTSGASTSATSHQNFANAWDAGKYILVTNDITIDSTSWSPIGTGSGTNAFCGTFDGGKHLITFSNPIKLSLTYCGLFGYASGATIKNVGVNWKEGLTGNRYTGGIVGSTTSANISNCYNVGNLKAQTLMTNRLVYCGGIVGKDSSGTEINNCYNIGKIEALLYSSENPGGGSSSIFSYKLTTYGVTVVYNAFAGGISGNGGTIYNCFSAVGTSENAPSATGGSTNYSGGIVGDGGTVYNCYYDYGGGSGTQVLTTAGYAKDLADYVKNATYFSSEDKTLSGNNTASWDATYPWDFDKVWTIDSEGVLNDGYPYLQAVSVKVELLTFDIELVKGNGEANGTLSVKDSVPQATEVTVPTRNGYKFLGYYNGETQYINENGAVEQDSSYYMTEIAELTAKWQANEYTITYYDQNGSTLSGNNASNPSTYTIESAEITLQAPTSRSGYTFAGWSTTKGGTIQTTVKIASGSTGNKKYYARWNVITYKITCKDSKTNATLKTYNYTVEDAVTLYTPSKTGYTFTGWSTTIGGPKQSTVTISKGTTGNKTYYANWTLITYTIAYKDVNNEDISTDNPSSYNIETATIILKAPTTTPTGKVFVRWSTTQDGTSPITQIAQGSTVNYTLYAIFTDATVTLTLKCTNFANQNYMIYIYDGNTQVMQIYPNSATQTITLKYSSNKYTVQFVFGYYGQMEFGACVNATPSGRKVVLDSFNADSTASISYTISTPKLNGIVI